jgi:uncharacterized DUF497 family protein
VLLLAEYVRKTNRGESRNAMMNRDGVARIQLRTNQQKLTVRIISAREMSRGDRRLYAPVKYDSGPRPFGR